MRLTLIIIMALWILPACASSYASKCQEWQAYKSWYELKIGAVERHDTFRCTSFAEAP